MKLLFSLQLIINGDGSPNVYYFCIFLQPGLTIIVVQQILLPICQLYLLFSGNFCTVPLYIDLLPEAIV